MGTSLKGVRLKWGYCECGCHGNEIQIGPLYYWMFNNLKGSFSVYLGHAKMGELMGTYSSWGEADRAVREHAWEQIDPILKVLGRRPKTKVPSQKAS